jgi:hypothetical protein
MRSAALEGSVRKQSLTEGPSVRSASREAELDGGWFQEAESGAVAPGSKVGIKKLKRQILGDGGSIYIMHILI